MLFNKPPLEILYTFYVMSMAACGFRYFDLIWQSEYRKWLWLVLLFPPSLLYLMYKQWDRYGTTALCTLGLIAFFWVVAALIKQDFTYLFITDVIRVCFWPWILYQKFIQA